MPKKVAKKFYVENVELFDYLISMESEAKHTSMTKLIEQHIFNDLLKTENTKHYIEIVMHSSLHDGLSAVFADIANEKYKIKPTPHNLEKIFLFAYEHCSANFDCDFNYSYMDRFMLPFRNLIFYIEEWLEANKDLQESPSSKYIYESYDAIYRWMIDLNRNKNSYPIAHFARSVYTLIRDGWDVFYSEKATYELLSNIEAAKSTHDPYNNSPIEWEFLELMNEVTL